MKGSTYRVGSWGLTLCVCEDCTAADPDQKHMPAVIGIPAQRKEILHCDHPNHRDDGCTCAPAKLGMQEIADWQHQETCPCWQPPPRYTGLNLR